MTNDLLSGRWLGVHSNYCVHGFWICFDIDLCTKWRISEIRIALPFLLAQRVLTSSIGSENLLTVMSRILSSAFWFASFRLHPLLIALPLRDSIRTRTRLGSTPRSHPIFPSQFPYLYAHILLSHAPACYSLLLSRIYSKIMCSSCRVLSHYRY